MTNFNERTNTLLYKKYASYTLFERVDVGCVWEVSRRRGQTATQSSSDHSSTSSSSWLGLLNRGSLRAASPQSASWFSRWHLVPNWLQLQQELELELTDLSRPWLLVIFLFDAYLFPVGVRICSEFNHVHRSRWYSDIFDWIHLFRCSSAYLHRCISWLTARSKVNML